VRQRRRGQGGGPRRPGGRDRRPRSDEAATPPEGSEQPQVEPEAVEPAAEAPQAEEASQLETEEKSES
jgi:hypothetical protein